MAKYAQANRMFRADTVLGPDALMLTNFSGVEGICVPFSFHLNLLSENPAVSGDDLLRTPVTLTVELEGGKERKLHGIINRFVQMGQQDELTAYQAEMVPWLWFLSLSRDCKIFQNLTALEIIEKVFKAQGYSDFQVRCSGSYAKREYCVQYRETHLDFVSRLMEEEGIFYFFEHTASKHTLVLADNNSAFAPCPQGSRSRMASQGVDQGDMVLSLTKESSIHVGKVTLKSYDYLQPSLSLKNSVSGAGREEVFDYSGRYTTLEGGDRNARMQLEAEEALRHIVRGDSVCRPFQSGCTFELSDHYRADLNQSYLLLQVNHSGSAPSYHSWGEEEAHYQNTFLAIPSKVRYRPVPDTPKPVVRGSQTAVVVGKAGEEIWVDKHGRVKVQFHWDRDGKKDENSSCWVRVSSAWAGKGWGAVHIPRIGQEVLVDFLEGDPDRPIITGRVYNAEQTAPYALPANQTQSGVKSRSSKGAGSENFNELRFEDKKGSEEVFLQAEKDLKAVVKNDETREVRRNRTTTIKNHETKTVKEGNETITLEKGNQALTIQTGNQSVTVTKGNQTTEIKMGHQKTTLGQGNQEVTIQMGNQTTKLDMGNLVTKLGLGKETHEAMQGIEFKVGQSSIKIDQAGITIKGMTIKIEGKVQTQIKGLQTQINGSAMLQIKGGITMIN
jgi:type VI secretion system secreted protein VgrG